MAIDDDVGDVDMHVITTDVDTVASTHVQVNLTRCGTTGIRVTLDSSVSTYGY